jgi:Asp-tRNA(Asn)/Glu-tRNA(Gln) amidotransferase A subunit family amidase
MKDIQNIDDATSLLKKIRTGELSVENIVREHLEQLEKINPEINAATKIYKEEALAQAKSLDHNGNKDLPLFGLPCSIKETFGIAGEEITAGSIRRKPSLSKKDSTIVAKLKAGGVVIIARSNIPEFAMTGESSNLRYGRTNNPLDISRAAGGSSGGEGALVGSGSSIFGVGSDILGSIRIPAAFCGIVGFKPHSKGVDKTGTWPEVNTTLKDWLCCGPLTRSVRDAELVYNVIANNSIPKTQNSFTELLIPKGFPIKYEQQCIKKAVDEARKTALNYGLKQRSVNFDKVPKLFLNIPKIILNDFYNNWIKDLSSSEEYGKFSVFKEFFAQLFGKATIDHGLLKWIALSPIMKSSNKKKKESIENSFIDARKAYRQIIGENGVLIMPTLGLLAPKHNVFNRKTLLDPRVNGLTTSHTLANYLDLPAISIPAWKYKDQKTGLPPSISLICNPGQEDKLFNLAKIIEKSLK